MRDVSEVVLDDTKLLDYTSVLELNVWDEMKAVNLETLWVEKLAVPLVFEKVAMWGSRMVAH